MRYCVEMACTRTKRTSVWSWLSVALAAVTRGGGGVMPCTLTVVTLADVRRLEDTTEPSVRRMVMVPAPAVMRAAMVAESRRFMKNRAPMGCGADTGKSGSEGGSASVHVWVPVQVVHTKEPPGTPAVTAPPVLLVTKPRSLPAEAP